MKHTNISSPTTPKRPVKTAGHEVLVCLWGDEKNEEDLPVINTRRAGVHERHP